MGGGAPAPPTCPHVPWRRVTGPGRGQTAQMTGRSRGECGAAPTSPSGRPPVCAGPQTPRAPRQQQPRASGGTAPLRLLCPPLIKIWNAHTALLCPPPCGDPTVPALGGSRDGPGVAPGLRFPSTLWTRRGRPPQTGKASVSRCWQSHEPHLTALLGAHGGSDPDGAKHRFTHHFAERAAEAPGAPCRGRAAG